MAIHGFNRPGTSTAASTEQSFSSFCTAGCHFPLAGSKLPTHRVRHCSFVRPGTSEATATQSLPCFSIASVNFVSSSGSHLPFFVPLVGYKLLTHRLRHCLSVRPGTSAATVTQQSLPCFLTASMSFASSFPFQRR
jgi:hypothetical protein